MSGHSKWATTKRQKAVVDAKRGAAFTKIGNLIAIAARKGADPASNPALAMAIDKAKEINMPKANIERAIARVADKSAAVIEEITYEVYGQGGAGIIVEVATDNRNRTFPELKSTITKHGGRLAEPGSVLFQFDQKGVIEASPNNEDNFLLALDTGATDVQEEDDVLMVYTEPKDLILVRDKLLEAGLKILSAEISYVPKVELELSEVDSEKVLKLLDVIDDMDDVINVHTNVK